MYRPALDARHKSGAVAGVIAIHAGLAMAFLHLSGTVDLTDPEAAMRVFDITEAEPPPPEPPPPPPQMSQKEKPKEKEGGSAPKNIKSEATPVVAPKPPIEIPTPPQIATSETPRQGTDPTLGASDVRGPGTGAGGQGTGTGSGGYGSGPGGGGDGLATVRTRLATRPLRGRDFPPEMLDAWPRGVRVDTRLRVDANGFVTQCVVDHGTGNPTIDNQICAIVQARLRFRPALDRYGRRVADWFGYGQEPPR